MSRRFGSSSTQGRGRIPHLPDMLGEYPLGRHTGLPLILCPNCGKKRVLELVVQTDDHGNRGKVFFKCPSNVGGMEGVPGWCGFYEWPREYLAILVAAGKIVMVLGQPAGGEEEEVDSMAVVAGGPVGGAIVPVQKTTMEANLDALIAAVKVLSLVLGAGVLVAAAYVFK